MQSIIDIYVVKFKNPANIYLIDAFLLNKRLHNNYRAVFSLLQCQEKNPSYSQQFQMYRLKSQIEEEMFRFNSESHKELTRIFDFDKGFRVLV